MNESLGCLVHGSAKSNSLEFEGIRNEAGRNSFFLSAKAWIERTHAQGLTAVTPAQAAIVYANEADLLNVALFGRTAKQWREANPDLDGNMRDHAAIEQLLVLANLEGMNAEFIRMGMSQAERLKRLNEIAIRQMQTLTAQPGVRRLNPPTEGNP